VQIFLIINQLQQKLMNMIKLIKTIDQKVTKCMHNISSIAIRISFGVIFIWFGILKPFNISSAESLLLKTVEWLPFGAPELWLIIIGWWEVAIGVLFLIPKTTKIAIILLFLQMFGTFMPLFLLPELTFQDGNIFAPTLEGQYIIKNLMIISGALVLGGKYYNAKKAA
jgi:uncharacterized membrane protein YphA (DoxX/SURF4 family)